MERNRKKKKPRAPTLKKAHNDLPSTLLNSSKLQKKY